MVAVVPLTLSSLQQKARTGSKFFLLQNGYVSGQTLGQLAPYVLIGVYPTGIASLNAGYARTRGYPPDTASFEC